MPSYNCVG